MASLIEQLQAEAMDSSTSVADLLRKAKVVATKLGLKSTVAWVDHELNGYPTEQLGIVVPEYRNIRGLARAWTPAGWIPMGCENPEMHASLTSQRQIGPIAELEFFLQHDGAELSIPYPLGLVAAMSRMVGWEIPKAEMVFGKNQIGRIVDAVRSRILDWAVQLELAGVKGEGTLSFSKKDQEAAALTTYNINIAGSVTGAVGRVGEQATVNATSRIDAETLKALQSLAAEVAKHAGQMNLAPQQQEVLEKTAAALSSELATSEPSPQKVKGFLSSIRNIAEGTTGSLIASGIQQVLSRPEIALLFDLLR